FVQAAVKHALAQYSITPTIEFDLDPTIQQLEAVTKPFTEEKQAAAAGSALFKNFTQKHQAHFITPTEKSELKNWKDFYEAPGEKFESLLDQLKKEEPAEALITPQKSALVVD